MITLIRTKSGILPGKDRYLWTAVDENGKVGTGHSQNEAVGDLVLGYKEIEEVEPNIFTVQAEIK